MLTGDGETEIELPDHIREFLERYPVDERAQSYLLGSSENVIERVIQEFKPKQEGEENYSGLLTSFIKRLRNSTPAEPRPSALAYNGEVSDGKIPLGAELEAAVEDFVQRYPIDDGAQSFLVGSPPDVVARVLKEFRPKSEGDNDYSALVMTFVKRCRGDQRVALVQEAGHRAPTPHYTAPPSQTECSRFFERYPVDERALDYFDMSSPEVQWKVLEEFKPKHEGESDYSGLLTSFCKRLRNNASHDMAPTFPAPTFGVVGGKGFGGKGKGFAGPPVQPVMRPGMLQPGGPGPLDFEAFRNRFPMDERAFSYLTESSPEVADRVLATFVPPRLDDTDFSAPVTAYVKQCRKQFPAAAPTFSAYGAYPTPTSAYGVRGGPFSRAPLLAPTPQKGAWHGGSGQPHRAAGMDHVGGQSRELQQFLQRYPCDERATDYLTTQSPEIIDRVVREFRAKREGDSDYSAIVMSFTKRCRDQGPASGGQSGLGAGGAGSDAELRRFLDRYPCDERAIDFLCTQTPDVIHRVVNEFAAKREGDSDYSAIVMSFTKRCKDDSLRGGGGGYGVAFAPPWKRARTY